MHETIFHNHANSDGHQSYIVAEDGSGSQEPPDEYMIWTPRSWSDNDSIPASSIAGKSTSDMSKPRSGQTASHVPQELLDVIERQDSVIERLVTWCQTLEDQAITHRMKLVEHEKAKDDYTNFRATLRSELTTLKASARKKAKEHSLEANELYERMQAKVDSRVAAWCSRQEGLCTKPNRSGSPPPSSHAPTGSSQVVHSRSKASLGAPPVSRVVPHNAKGGPLQQRMPGRSYSTKELPTVRSAKHTSPLRDRCFERSASPEGTRQSKRNGLKTSPSSLGQKGSSSQTAPKNTLTADTALPSGVQTSSMNSLSPEVQKAIREQSSPRHSLKAVSSKASLREPVSPKNGKDSWCIPSRAMQGTNKSPENSWRPMRQAPTSPGRASKSPPRHLRVGAADSMGQGFKFVARSVSPPANMLEDRLGSPKRSPRRLPETTSGGRSSAQEACLPCRSSPRRSPLRHGMGPPHATQLPEKPISPKSSFVPPPRVGGASIAGLTMQSFSSIPQRTSGCVSGLGRSASGNVGFGLLSPSSKVALGPTPPASPSKMGAKSVCVAGFDHSVNGNVGLGLLSPSAKVSKAAFALTPPASPRKVAGTMSYNQATGIFGKASRTH